MLRVVLETEDVVVAWVVRAEVVGVAERLVVVVERLVVAHV